jgi:hypothetical protein
MLGGFVRTDEVGAPDRQSEQLQHDASNRSRAFSPAARGLRLCRKRAPANPDRRQADQPAGHRDTGGAGQGAPDEPADGCSDAPGAYRHASAADPRAGTDGHRYSPGPDRATTDR